MQRRHLRQTHRLQERAAHSVQPQLLTRSSVFIPPTLKPLSVSFQEQGACSCTSRSCDRSGRMKSLAVPPNNSKHRLMGEMRENNFCSFSSVTLKALPLFVVCSFAVTQQVYIWIYFQAVSQHLKCVYTKQQHLSRDCRCTRSRFLALLLFSSLKFASPTPPNGSLRRFPSLLSTVAGSHRLPIPIVFLASCFAVYFPV